MAKGWEPFPACRIEDHGQRTMLDSFKVDIHQLIDMTPGDGGVSVSGVIVDPDRFRAQNVQPGIRSQNFANLRKIGDARNGIAC